MSYPIVDRRGLRRAGSLPAFLAVPGAWLYSVAVGVHGDLHDRGLLPRSEIGRVPVVSVGALTVGGAGKTPMTRWLAARLLERGFRPAILTRGYRSTGSREPRVVDPGAPDGTRDGDEPALLARSLPGVPVIVAPDRRRGATLVERCGADLVVLDDGFQHRRLHRDADIVLWDRAAELSRGRLLPGGLLREPVRSLRRADLLVLVDRGEGAPAAPPGGPPSTAVFRARLVPVPRQSIAAGRAVHALSGIADPESFERSLSRLGLRVTGATRFADHHAFSIAEVKETVERATREQADFVAVTAKDHVRWPGDPDGRVPVPAVFDLDVEMDAGDHFVETVVSLVEDARS